MDRSLTRTIRNRTGSTEPSEGPDALRGRPSFETLPDKPPVTIALPRKGWSPSRRAGSPSAPFEDDRARLTALAEAFVPAPSREGERHLEDRGAFHRFVVLSGT